MKTHYKGYFDYASATPTEPLVSAAMQPYGADLFYNPSALYSHSRKVRGVLSDARQKTAQILGVKASEIIFTAGCTEANNLAIQGVLQAHAGSRILVSAIEHDSVLNSLKTYPGETIPVLASGLVDLDALRSLLDDTVVLVSVMYANNEVGSVQPLREISYILNEERKKRGPAGLPLYFHTDAAQAGNYLMMKAHSLGVQLMSINGGKIYGPKASGCLFVASEVVIKPIMFGGNQESGLRSGTENVSAIVGFTESLAMSAELAPQESKRLTILRDKLIKACKELGGVIYGSKTKYLPNIVNVGFPGVDNEQLVIKLDDLGFQVASGSACHATSGEVSQVLTAMGLTNNLSRESIRISMGRQTTATDVLDLSTALRQLLAK